MFANKSQNRRHNTQYNDTQHNDNQHNDTQHNDTQHKAKCRSANIFDVTARSSFIPYL